MPATWLCLLACGIVLSFAWVADVVRFLRVGGRLRLPQLGASDGTGTAATAEATAAQVAAGWRRKQANHAYQMGRQIIDNSTECNRWFQDNWEPTFFCVAERRLGRYGRGGKWVCDPHALAEPCVVYSLGEPQWDFERELLGYANCDFHAFGPAVDGSSAPAFVRYHPIDTGGISDSLLLGAQTGMVDVLKVNDVSCHQCDGGCGLCVWEIVQKVLAAVTVRQILVSLDCSAPRARLAHNWFEDLTRRGYVVFHKEADTTEAADRCGYSLVLAPPGLANASHAYARLVAEPGPLPRRSSLALRESGGFFDDDDETWALRKCNHVAQMRRQKNEHTWYAYPRFWMNNWEPSFPCAYAQRIGAPGDGGKWVCDPYRIGQLKSCLVYSVGSNGQSDFEQSIHDFFGPHCEIHTFDPNPWEHYTPQPMPSFMNYHQFGISNRDTDKFKTMPTVIKELGHAGRTIEIFKIDCEGCEWSTYTQWLSPEVNIRQINIELHPNGWEPVYVTANRFFDDLDSHGFVIHHKESNTLGCGGGCLEYGLVRLQPGIFRDIATSQQSAYHSVVCR